MTALIFIKDVVKFGNRFFRWEKSSSLLSLTLTVMKDKIKFLCWLYWLNIYHIYPLLVFFIFIPNFEEIMIFLCFIRYKSELYGVNLTLSYEKIYSSLFGMLLYKIWLIQIMSHQLMIFHFCEFFSKLLVLSALFHEFMC